MSFSRRFIGHLRTVCTHKYYVAEGCFKTGLILQGLVHDLSKFSPTEFRMGVRYFDGHRSPNAVERIMNDGLSTAWLHHKGRNRHHYEYWVDFGGIRWPSVFPNRMPLKYVAEMVCDRRAACITYNKEHYTSASAWEHYQLRRGLGLIHPDTQAVLESCLKKMRDDGDEACFRYMRELLKVTKGRDYTADTLPLYEADG